MDDIRAASPIYSRDASAPRFPNRSMPLSSNPYKHAEVSKYAADEPNISPPDSPVDMPSAKRYSDVSPVESDSHFFAEVPKKKPSQLPVPQKHSQSNALPGGTAASQGSEGVSDGYSASTSTTPQDSRSASPLADIADSKGKDGSKLLSAGKERLQILSKTRDQKQLVPKQPQVREQWKGASGRFPLVPPIDTKSFTTNNKQPRPRVETDPNRLSYLGQDPNAYVVTTISASSPAHEKTHRSNQFRLRSRTTSPAARDSSRGPEVIVKQITGPTTHETTFDRVTNQSTTQLVQVETPTPVLEKQSQEPSSLSDMFRDLSVEREPRSRFSASTYAPTEAATTPPGSSHADAPPVPSIEHSPIMTRRRPVPSSTASIKSMKRKPISSGDTAPPPPELELKLSPEEQTQRRIDSLEARRLQLSLRKDSIKTMLHELTEVIQPSSIAYDMATRDEVKKTVNSLKTELDDIGKEDHEIGMKLVRLYKNLDNASEFEHSSLWVKRVTS